MTNFFNKLKKPCSWPIFGLFSQFWGQKKKKNPKNPAIMQNFVWFSSTMPKLRKN